MTALTQAGIFIVGLVFDAYIILLILRLLLQKFGASYHNPISQLVIKLTHIVVTPLQKVLPGIKGFDLAVVLLIILFEMIETVMLFWLRTRIGPNLWGTLIITIAMIGDKLVNLYFYAIIIRAIMSWIVSLQYNPMAEIIYVITEPILRLVRRFIPTIAGLDLSFILVLVILQLISILGFNSLANFGAHMTFM